MRVITYNGARVCPGNQFADALLMWVEPDDRGIELEIVAVDLDDVIVVLHVMPASLRR